MNARDIEMAGLEVERSRHRAVRWLSAGGIPASISIALLPFSQSFAVTLGCGAVLEMLLAAVLWLRGRERIDSSHWIPRPNPGGGALRRPRV
jgi:hypothetical protein